MKARPNKSGSSEDYLLEVPTQKVLLGGNNFLLTLGKCNALEHHISQISYLDIYNWILYEQVLFHILRLYQTRLVVTPDL